MKRSTSLLLFAMSVAFSLSFSLPLRTIAAQPNDRILGQYGGRCMGVAVQGDYAYVLEGYNLITLDISNPATPKVTSRISLSQFPHEIKVSGNKLVVNCWWGYQIYVITRPDAPVYAGGVAEIFGMWQLSGDLMYVIDGGILLGTGLKIIDISNPAQPRVRARYVLDPASCPQINSMTVAGVYILWFSNPYHPTAAQQVWARYE